MFEYCNISVDYGVLRGFVSPEEKGIYRPARSYQHQKALYHPLVTQCKAVHLVIPEGIHAIGDGALERCFALTRVTIPESVESIGVNAFLNCNNLEEIMFPSDLKTIRGKAFAHCTSLTKLTIPDSVESIGSSAFAGCTKLQEIRLPDQFCKKVNAIFGGDDVDVRMYSAVCSGKLKVNPSLVSWLESSFRKKWDSAVRQLIAADNSESMKRYLALWKNKPVAVEKLDAAIERSVAAKTTDITALLMDYKRRHYTPERQEARRQREAERAMGLRAPTVADWQKVFAYDTEEDGLVIKRYKGEAAVIEVPALIGRKPVIAIEQWSFNSYRDYWCKPSSDDWNQPYRIVLPEGLRQIREHAFDCCTHLTNIVLPKTLAEIGKGAFSGCKSLQEVSIPEGITCIESETFYNCIALHAVQIPESVQRIHWDAFQNCSNLREISLPKNVLQIDAGCWENEDLAVWVPRGSITEETLQRSEIPYRLV